MRFTIALAIAGLFAASFARAEDKVVRKEVKKEDHKEAHAEDHKEAHDEAHDEGKADAKADAKAEAKAEAKADASVDVKVEVNGGDAKVDGGKPSGRGGMIDPEAFKREFEKRFADMKKRMQDEMDEAKKGVKAREPKADGKKVRGASPNAGGDKGAAPKAGEGRREGAGGVKPNPRPEVPGVDEKKPDGGCDEDEEGLEDLK
jgi:hypothetical protein